MLFTSVLVPNTMTIIFTAQDCCKDFKTLNRNSTSTWQVLSTYSVPSTTECQVLSHGVLVPCWTDRITEHWPTSHSQHRVGTELKNIPSEPEACQPLGLPGLGLYPWANPKCKDASRAGPSPTSPKESSQGPGALIAQVAPFLGCGAPSTSFASQIWG